MVKRFADWLEKISVGLLLSALLHDLWSQSYIKSLAALILGLMSFGVSIYLTIIEEENERK